MTYLGIVAIVCGAVGGVTWLLFQVASVATLHAAASIEDDELSRFRIGNEGVRPAKRGESSVLAGPAPVVTGSAGRWEHC
ncbi:MAG: hypothetical protein JSS02_03480 [Planctomycetes bacterium]|nr:hypothetical protein [Planctomycetota bacterium]